jgi:CHAT domain-containing protein
MCKQASDHPPRLWWCPAGPFSFLPLHAARSIDGKQSTTSFVVSSYTPTLEALSASQMGSTVMTDPKVLVVAQSDVEGLPRLKYVAEEYTCIRAAVSDEYMLMVDGSGRNQQPGEGQHTTPEEVLRSLNDASVLHLSCHGVQDRDNPLDSALILEGGKLTISKMQSHRRTKLASLAYLSACMTATGEPSQSDEVIHMAASMLSAGFQGVVATMWYV